MPDHEPPPTTTAADDLHQRLDRLEAGLAELRRRHARLRQQLAGEVRTRRLVVVEEDGFERLTLDGAGHFGALAITARPQTDAAVGSVAVEVFAADARDGDPPHIGLALLDGGDVVAAVDLQSGRPPMLWLAGRGDPPAEPS